MQGLVVKAIALHTAGLVKVNSELWAARTVNGEVVEVDSMVEVIDVRGAHVIVKKL
jgi:membrane protein implicated in regulation of membrane protease activity